MARIRTIKPEFFRHELLQELERAHPGKHCMLVFAGLFGHCERTGTFEWKPRQLKLDILPYLDFDMAETLSVLAGAGLVRKWETPGKVWGSIPTFRAHQRITGKECEQKLKFPQPPEFTEGSTGELFEHQLGSSGETPATHPGAQEGKGREQEQEGKGNRFAEPAPAGLDEKAWEDWRAYNQRRGHPIPPESIAAAQRVLAGFHMEQRKVVDQAIAGTWKNLLPLKRVGDQVDPIADKAWEDTRKAVNSGNGIVSDPRCLKALQAIGGTQRVRMMTVTEVPIVRRQFIKAYSEAA